MRQPAYLKPFSDKLAAKRWAAMKQEANRIKGWRWVIVAGPHDGWSVVDIKTAIELGCGYEWEA